MSTRRVLRLQLIRVSVGLHYYLSFVINEMRVELPFSKIIFSFTGGGGNFEALNWGHGTNKVEIHCIRLFGWM